MGLNKMHILLAMFACNWACSCSQPHALTCTPIQVRKLSVKQITSPVTYDNSMNVVPDGLYDSALGPVDFNGRCVRQPPLLPSLVGAGS